MILKTSLSEMIGSIGIHNMDFHHTSYREYFGCIGNYIIAVYPFILKLYGFGGEFECNRYLYPSCFRGDLEMQKIKYKLIEDRHHQDFNKGIITIDPCDIFEEVCGVKIHSLDKSTGLRISDNHLFKDDYTEDITRLKAKIRMSMRTDKILKIIE